jgi:glutathione peroxidase
MSQTTLEPSLYQFEVTTMSGEVKKLSEFKGKLLLVVNIASGCGFAPQLKELENLYKLYNHRGLEIIACPSNDFGKQEPLSNEGIQAFCKSNYDISFLITQKIHVKGVAAHPLFTFLADKKLNTRSNGYPKWNFHKYLMNRNGRMVDFFYSFTRPESVKVKKVIEANL